MPKSIYNQENPSGVSLDSQDDGKEPVISEEKFIAITENFIEAKAAWRLLIETNNDKIKQSVRFTETAEAVRKKSMQLLEERKDLDNIINDLYQKKKSGGFGQIDLEQRLLDKYILTLQIYRYQWIEEMCCSFERINNATHQNDFKRFSEAESSFANAMHYFSNLVETEWKKMQDGAFEADEFIDVLTNYFNENQESFCKRLCQRFSCNYEYEISYQKLIDKIQFLLEKTEWLPPEIVQQQSALLSKLNKLINESKPYHTVYQSVFDFAKLQLADTRYLPAEMKIFIQYILNKDLISLTYLQKKARLNSQFSQQISTVHLYQQLNPLLVPSNPAQHSTQQQITELGKQLAKVTADKQHQMDTIIEVEPFLEQIELIDSKLKSEKEKLSWERVSLLNAKSKGLSSRQPPRTLLFLISNRVLQDKIYRLKTDRKNLIKRHRPFINKAIAALAQADISEKIYTSTLKKYNPDVPASKKNIVKSISKAAVLHDCSLKFEIPLMTILQQQLNTSEEVELTYDEFLKRIITILDNPYWNEPSAEQESAVFIKQFKTLLSGYSNQSRQQQFTALKNKAAQLYENEWNPAIFRKNLPENIRLLISGIINQDLIALNLLLNKIDYFEQETRTGYRQVQ